MTAGALATQSTNFLLHELEAVKGTPAASFNHVTPVSGMTIGATFDVLRQNIFYGSRHAEQVLRVLKGKLAGNVVQALMPNSAALMLLAALGKEIWMPAMTADAIKTGGATDANGLTTIPLVNTGALTYTLGALATVGAPASGLQELAQIVGITGNGAANTILTMKGLKAATPRLAATPVMQIAQHHFTTRGPLDSIAWDLPSLTLQRNKARQWAWNLAGSQVAKMELRAGREAVEMTSTMVCTQEPQRLDPGSFAVFAPTQQQRQELTRPWTIRQGYVVVPNDQAGAGASSLSALYEVEEWSVAWDNHHMDKEFWNLKRIKDSFPGTTSGAITIKFASSAGRPSGFEDFLFAENAPTIPFFATLGQNRGIPTAPVWHGCGIYTPAMLVTKADNPDTLNDLVSETIDATIVEDDLGSAPLHFFVANDNTVGAYAGL